MEKKKLTRGYRKQMLVEKMYLRIQKLGFDSNGLSLSGEVEKRSHFGMAVL
jgi:hypothetical protein